MLGTIERFFYTFLKPFEVFHDYFVLINQNIHRSE